MNIAVFASSFAPHIGGVEELVQHLCQEYQDRGHTAIVVTNRWPPELPAVSTCNDTLIYRVPMRIPGGPWRARLKFRLTHRRLERDVRIIARRHRIDIVHVQCVSTNGYYAGRVAQQLDLPLVVTSQGERTMDATNVFGRSAGHNIILRELLARADFVTACSRNTLADLERYVGAPFGQRGAVIYNGVSTEAFADAGIPAYSHPAPYVLAIGRWVPQKGFDVLLQAFSQAAQQAAFGHDLLLAGAGSEQARLEALVAHLGLGERVHLLGAVDRPRAIALFKGCSFFALPSRQEPLGIVNLEAMAAGKAIVASAVGGVPEIVLHDENGLLIPSEDVGALSAALTRLATDEKLRSRLGAAGHGLVQAFAWPRIVDQYESLYTSVLALRRPSSVAWL